MRDNIERIELMHKRAYILKRNRDRNLLRASGAVSGVLLVLLLAVALHFDRKIDTGPGGLYTASSLLASDFGAFVLVGVVAFALGVLLTVVIKKHLKRKEPNKLITGEEK